MPYRHEPERIKAVGNSDGSVSPYTKFYLKQDMTLICGVIGEGTTVNLNSNWDAPFDSVTGGAADMIDGALQLSTDTTLRNSFTTTQIWGGNNPVDISLSAVFYAISDPETEVELAIEALRRFASPELREVIPIGQSPQSVSLNLKRRLILSKCVIESVSEPFDTIVDSKGARISATVQVSLSTKRTLSRSEL